MIEQRSALVVSDLIQVSDIANGSATILVENYKLEGSLFEIDLILLCETFKDFELLGLG